MKNVRFFLTFSLYSTVFQRDAKYAKSLKTLQRYTFSSKWQNFSKKK